jgi:hypothetical protein
MLLLPAFWFHFPLDCGAIPISATTESYSNRVNLYKLIDQYDVLYKSMLKISKQMGCREECNIANLGL